jgi:hypothetical protein
MSFRPNDLTKNEILETIRGIESILDVELAQYNDFSFLNGKSGISLFYAYWGMLLKDQKRLKKSCSIMMECLESVENKNYSGSFGNGVAGILFSYQLLMNEGILNGPKSFLRKFDKIMIDECIYLIENGNYDLFYGGLGIAAYLFERNEMTNQNKKIVWIYQALKKISIESEYGLGWLNYPSGFDKEVSSIDREYDLGFAHGMPSIISFFSVLIKNKIITSKVELTKSISFILNTLNRAANPTSFPYFINQDLISNRHDGVSRFAYCYGDLGVSYSLSQALKVVDDKKLVSDINLIISKLTKRSVNDSGANDAGFCHGLSGIYHVLSKISEMCMDTKIQDTLPIWLEELLSMKRGTSKLGRFEYNKYDAESKQYYFKREINILEGYSGIGLVLISSISNLSSNWDRALLLRY